MVEVEIKTISIDRTSLEVLEESTRLETIAYDPWERFSELMGDMFLKDMERGAD